MNSPAVRGAVSGVVAGIAFAVVLAFFGMDVMKGLLVKISGLVTAQSVTVGVILHLVFSAIIGAIFGVVSGSKCSTYGYGAGLGLVYGLVWWVLGPLVVMPVWIALSSGGDVSIPLFSVEGIQGAVNPSLWLHIAYGLVLGLVYVAFGSHKSAGDASYATNNTPENNEFSGGPQDDSQSAPQV